MSVKTKRLSLKNEVFKRFFETEDGKQVLAEMKHFCCLERQTIHMGGVQSNSDGSVRTTGAIDPYATIYNEGKRVVLLHMLELASLTYEDIKHIETIDEMTSHEEDIENAVFSN